MQSDMNNHWKWSSYCSDYTMKAHIQILKKKRTSHYISRFNVSLPDITKVWNMKKTSVNIPTAYMYYQPTPSHLNLINMKGSKPP